MAKGEPVTMYCHSDQQISRWANEFGFRLQRSLASTVFMDREKTRRLKAKAYLAKNAAGID